ncbi:MAG TPA: hypothetical protein VL860_13195 [Planctomycetota bacterium]|nr:hypothetical protein [Planctomycetota bacterium]
MKIVPCHSRSGSKGSLWALLTFAMLVGVLPATGRLAGADQAPDVRPILEELNSGNSLFHFTINRNSVIWSELNRSTLFKMLSADASFAASMQVLRDTIGGRLKTVEATQAGAGAGFTYDQLGRFGPMAAFMSSDPKMDLYARMLAGHDVAPDYLRVMTSLLFEDGERFLQQTFVQPNPMFAIPSPAYRVRNNWMILQTDSMITALVSDHRYLLVGSSAREDEALKLWKQPLTGHLDAFAKYLTADAPWLTGFMADFDRLGELADSKQNGRGPENPDLFGPKGLRMARAKEWVNADGRFEAVAEAQGADLHKNLFFAGADKPLNLKLAGAIPADAALALYLNTEMGAIERAGPDDFAGHSPKYAEFVKELQKEYSRILNGREFAEKPAGAGLPLSGPSFDRGFLFVMFDPDRLEEIESSIAVVFGVKPGFKSSEAWARMVLQCPKPEPGAVVDGAEGGQAADTFKSVDYSGVTIFSAKRWRTECIAVTDSAVVRANDLKNTKRLIKALQNAEKNTAADNKFGEWDKLQALAAKDAQSNFCGFALLRTPSILTKYGGMAMGGLALAYPQVKTDTNWAQISAGLQPSLGVLTYNAAQGFRAHTISDLPVASTIITAVQMGVLQEMRWENGGRWQGQHNVEEGDLPPAGGVVQNPGMDGGVEAVPVPVPEAVPAPAPAPAPAP